MNRIEIPIPPLDPLIWLSHQSLPQKLFWANRDRTEIVAGSGVADVVRCENRLDACFQSFAEVTYPQRYWGGFRFDPTRPFGAEWRVTGNGYFVLPKFEVGLRENRWFLAGNFPEEKRAEVDVTLQQMRANVASFSPANHHSLVPAPPFLKRTDVPDKTGWIKAINTTLRQFVPHAFEKVVLARRSIFEADRGIDPVWILQKLAKANPNTFLFLMQFSADSAFISATPERLYARQQRILQSEALAGTRPRGRSPEEDDQLQHVLLHSEKDRREHRIVTTSIRQAFEPLCESVTVEDGVNVLKLSQLQHLYQRVEGVLLPDQGEADIINRLHPTPAVGGRPATRALQHIREWEVFDRGWYAAPVGWASADASEFAVGIRSGLVAGRRLYLYAGAGIVPGSHPAAEWQEIENKQNSFLRALGVYPHEKTVR